MKITKSVAILLLAGFALVFVGLAPASTIMHVDYLPAGNVGDTWDYIDTDVMQFTWELTEITQGPNAGRLKLGNDSSGVVFDVSGNVVRFYEIDNFPLVPPLVFLESYETGVYYTIGESEVVFLIIPSITIQAGTFENVLVHLWLDSEFPPNSVNDQFGLSGFGITAAVTDVEWWAKDIGLLKFMGINSVDGSDDGGYELLSTTVLQSGTFQPALTTVNSNGNPTDAVITGAIYNEDRAIYSKAVTVGETISVLASISPEAAHIGQDLEVIVAVEVVATGDIILVTSSGLVPYSAGDPLSIFASIEDAAASNNISILSGFTTTEAEVGSYNFYLGYLVKGGDGSLYYTSEPIELVIGK